MQYLLLLIRLCNDVQGFKELSHYDRSAFEHDKLVLWKRNYSALHQNKVQTFLGLNEWSFLGAFWEIAKLYCSAKSLRPLKQDRQGEAHKSELTMRSIFAPQQMCLTWPYLPLTWGKKAHSPQVGSAFLPNSVTPSAPRRSFFLVYWRIHVDVWSPIAVAGNLTK